MFPIDYALTMAMAISHVTIIPSDSNPRTLVRDLPPQQSYQVPQRKDRQSHHSPNRENHVQQEILVGGHLIHSRAQVVGTIVTEDVADPVDSSGHRVAWLVFVNAGQKSCLLAIPWYGEREGLEPRLSLE